MSPQPNILENFLQEFKPGTDDNFNCLLSTDDVITILILNSTVQTIKRNEIIFALESAGFKYVLVDGEKFWKIYE